MRKKVFKLAVIGSILGMLIGNLISYLFCDKSADPLVIVSSDLIQRTGSAANATVVLTLLSGLLGAVCFSGVIFHDPDAFDWGLTKAALMHYLLILVFNIPTALYCGWCPLSAAALLIWIGILTLCYFIVWLVMFLRYKKETEELNRMLRNNRE